ncbi:hypothetical protein PUR57_00655, partial [Streptomyces sp. JV176]|uniref:hypothetical protein n=1 Tax=Streptomyces sp. JV176 TaxID=858630 RepID=UPI002E78538A
PHALGGAAQGAAVVTVRIGELRDLLAEQVLQQVLGFAQFTPVGGCGQVVYLCLCDRFIPLLL